MSFLFPLLFPLGAEIAKLYLGVIPTFPRAGQHCAPLPAQQPRGDSGYMGQGLDLGADRKATQTAGVWVMYPLCMDGDLALQDQVQVICMASLRSLDCKKGGITAWDRSKSAQYCFCELKAVVHKPKSAIQHHLECH